MIPEGWVPASPLAGEIRDAVRTLDLERLAARLDASPAFPRDAYRELGRRRLLGLVVPPSWGGRGMPLPEAGAALYELAYASGATTFAKLSLQPEFCSLLAEAGSPGLVERFYRPIARGEILVGNQITEPSAGSDVRGIRATATPTAGGYRLSGTKSEAAFAADAEAAIVFAHVPPHAGGPGGLSAFLVPQEAEGIVRTVVPDLGERWMRRGSVEYHEVAVPAEHRLGPEGSALSGVVAELDRERGLLAMIYLGVARRTLEETVAHVGTREAFGGPLSRQQAVAFPLTEAWAELDAASAYALEVLRRRASGRGSPGEPAMAKWMATERALRILDHAIQFHGGRGYSAALPFERRWRDVRSGALAHGTSEIMHVTAARALWGDRPKAPSSS